MTPTPPAGASADPARDGPRPGADGAHPAVHDPTRLAALVAMGLVEATLPDAPTEALERLARLAARALHVPVAQVNVVTTDAQVPVASVAHAERLPDGDPARWSAPVGLDASYCQHVVEAGAPVLVEDARVHPLVRDNRATVDAGIVAYAGAPLRARDGGQLLGSMCVMDFAPRAWSADDVALLEELADLAAEEIAGRTAALGALARQSALTRLVADNATSALFFMDADGHPTYMNPAATAVTGFTLDEIRHFPLHYAVHHHRPDGSLYPLAECPIDRALPENNEVRAHRDTFIRKDGSFFPVVCAASPILEGGRPVGTVVEVRDVTWEREAAQALVDMNAELEARNAQLQEQAAELEVQAEELRTTAAELEEQTLEAEEARARAEAANRAKSDFLAVMSHELRTPLNAIGGYAELLDMGLRGPVTEAQRADLARIQRSQQHLLGLINDVLNFAKLEAGRARFDLEDVALVVTLDDVSSMVLPQVRNRGLAYVNGGCDPALAVRADREKLQQILVNLLSNAIKFSDAPGTITMSCEAAADAVRVRVRDTGIGIPRGRLEQIFDPFVQVDPRLERAREGTGLGLAISRDLARGMGGDLTVESELGAGSTFTLTLPRAAAVRGGAAAAAEGRRSAAAADAAAVVRECEALLTEGGVHAVLAHLNGRVAHRFTGLYRLDPPTLRNVALFDRENPAQQVGTDSPISETYCSILSETETPFATADSAADPRLAGHPGRERVVSYCGELVRDARGTAVGTLCHFDVVPRPVPAAEVPVMEAVAALLAPAVERGR